jgi:hypothetical protein
MEAKAYIQNNVVLVNHAEKIFGDINEIPRLRVGTKVGKQRGGFEDEKYLLSVYEVDELLNDA